LAPDRRLAFGAAWPSRAAWYRLGPAPGQVGPALIVGHVDTKRSVAVFFFLSSAGRRFDR
jgi:hypothetical protein